MSYDNGMGPGPFYDNTPLPECVPRPDPLRNMLIADAFQEIANPRVSQQAVKEIGDIYMAKIRQLQDQLAQTMKERNEVVMKRDALDEVVIELAQKLGTPREELKSRYKEILKQKSEERGIPLD
jgi:glutamyl-tRNA reductase